MIGAPLCASLTAPFVSGSANGTLAFDGVGRFRTGQSCPSGQRGPVTFSIVEGRLAAVMASIMSRLRYKIGLPAPSHDEVFVLMDCNIGFDPRGDLMSADNTVVHSYAGGMMIGFGNLLTSFGRRIASTRLPPRLVVSASSVLPPSCIDACQRGV